ncbi:ankyrin repeat domain-containing protein [Candidatus Avelusimicrobium caledoniensis]|uniref:ankyrin repeat domain-containing protein n=1 Tax=Candidatus Avelusimicrobium caledoniensis TaxID=3416220 RepID=UPI003D0FACE1
MWFFIIVFCALCVLFKSVFAVLPFIGSIMLLGILLFLALFLCWTRRQPVLLVIVILAVIGLRGYLTLPQPAQPVTAPVAVMPKKTPTDTAPRPSEIPAGQPVCPPDVNTAHEHGWTPLKQAIFENDVQKVSELLSQCGGDPNYEQTWLTALQYGGAEVIAALLAKGMVIPNDVSGVVLLAYAGQAEPVTDALAQGRLSAQEKEYLLPWAAAGGNAAVVRMLLENGITQNRSLALQTAVNTGRTEVVRLLAQGQTLPEKEQKTLMRYAVEKGQVDIVKTLLETGIDVNTTDPFGFGQTSLFIAARKGDLMMTETLLAAGADPNLADATERQTPLHEVVESSGRIEVVRALVEAGADVNAKNNRPQTPLQLAVNKPEIAEYLRAHGAHE